MSVFSNHLFVTAQVCLGVSEHYAKTAIVIST